MSKLLVGAAKACIDPPANMSPVFSRINECEGIHDPSSCRVIAIDNGIRKVLLITFELSDSPTFRTSNPKSLQKPVFQLMI